VTPSELRVRAASRLSPHTDRRAADALARADIVVERSALVWDGSSGRVQAHGVGLGLDATLLGELWDAHAARDALVAAFAAAISEEPNQSLSDLRLFWSGRAASAFSGYRGGAPCGSAAAAMASFLRASGNIEAILYVEHAHIHVKEEPSRVSIRSTPPLPAEAVRAAKILYQGFERRHVEVR